LIDQTSAIERDELPFLHEAVVNQGALGDSSIPTWLTTPGCATAMSSDQRAAFSTSRDTLHRGVNRTT
jgi:hypothetical protein